MPAKYCQSLALFFVLFCKTGTLYSISIISLFWILGKLRLVLTICPKAIRQYKTSDCHENFETCTHKKIWLDKQSPSFALSFMNRIVIVKECGKLESHIYTKHFEPENSRLSSFAWCLSGAKAALGLNEMCKSDLNVFD